MHCSSEGVLVQEVWGKEIVEVGGGDGGVYVGVIYIVYIKESIVLTLGRYELVEFTMGGG